MSTGADVSRFPHLVPETPKDANSQPSGKEPVKTGCSGPAGTWPCALEFSHPGEHVRFAPEKLISERDELRSCLLIARPLLMDVEMNRGAALRRSLLARIDKALR